ncbi:MAG: hypothetical protein GY847_05685 [Proteobacteria bacterium]|nr:hypothetical protein [Pseudomonadota bacterium]
MFYSFMSGRLTHFFFGSWKRILTMCIVLIALAFALYKYGVVNQTSPEAQSIGPPSSPEGSPESSSFHKRTVGSANVPVHPMGLFSEHTALSKAFPIAPPKKTEEVIPAWWEKPNPLTLKEVGFLRYLSAMTWQLPRGQWSRFWNVGGNQTGLQTIRFYAGFIGYAAAAFGMRTPAYTGLSSKILRSAIEHILDRKAWSYVRILWGDKPWFPDPAAHENIMYTGHVLQLMTFYEAMTNDTRFRDEGFDFVWDANNTFHYDLMSLVDVTVKQMRDNPSGGVACEPRHVFVICNTHPHVALKLLEGLGLGDWSGERLKWERFFLDSFYDDVGGAAIKCVYHQDKKKFFPIGYAGTDGWALTWYSTWASDLKIPESIWQVTRKRAKEDLFELRPYPSRQKRPTLHNTADFISYLTAIVQSSLPPIPTGTFLYPAASACNDPETAVHLREVIEKRYLTQNAGLVFLKIPHKFNIGSNANMALGLALENGSNMRHFVQRPLPREYFKGPLIEDVWPDSVVILQAYREKQNLFVELGTPEPAEIVLKNVPAIKEIVGLPKETWSYKDNILHIKNSGRYKFRIVVD